jgi:hypothetical protein
MRERGRERRQRRGQREGDKERRERIITVLVDLV